MKLSRAHLGRFATPAAGLLLGAVVGLACSRPFTGAAQTGEPFCRLPSNDHSALVYVNDRERNTFRLTRAESQGRVFEALMAGAIKETARPVQRAEATVLLWHDNPVCYAYHGSWQIRYPC